MYHIFGHRSPDTDAIASAMVLQDYLQQLGHRACAYQLGKSNLESRFVLETLGLDALPLLPADAPWQILPEHAKICLTDHNESSHSICELQRYDIHYVIDHHKISLSTPTPAYVRIYPVGSTCTILLAMYAEKGLRPSQTLAKLMLCAIISDTLNLTGPTTTDDDRHAAKVLLSMAQMTAADQDALAAAMFAAKSNTAQIDAHELLLMDYKSYHIAGQYWGIAGIETTDIASLAMRTDELIAAAKDIQRTHHLDQLMIAIVDIYARTGYAIAHDDTQNAIITKAFDAQRQGNLFALTGIISRKKQIVPALERYLAAMTNDASRTA